MGTMFIYRGDLYHDHGGGMERMRKVSWGKWEWTPVRGFAARKIRRAIALRRRT